MVVIRSLASSASTAYSARLGLARSATTVSATGCLPDLTLACASATGMTLAASVLHFVLLEALFKNFHLFRALLSRSAAGFSARTTPAGFCHFS